MKKEELKAKVDEVRESWEKVISELGPQDLEKPGATGEWRVRDILAHFNGWDRWQLVQLRCAFTGKTPTDEELTGGVDFPDNDDMSEDAMNAMFEAGNRNRALEDVVADWREISAMRSDWLAAASQEQLDEVIGSDWTGEPNRNIRLASEVPNVIGPEKVWMRILDQVEHQRVHLEAVLKWMGK